MPRPNLSKLTIKKKYAFEGSVLIKVFAYKKVNGTTYKSKDGTYGNNEYYKPGKAKFTMTRTGFGEIKVVFPKYTNYQVIIQDSQGVTQLSRQLYGVYKGYEWAVWNMNSGERYKIKIREFAYTSSGKIMVGKWTVKYVRPY